MTAEYAKLQLEHENDIENSCRENAEHDDEIIKRIKTRQCAIESGRNHQHECQEAEQLTATDTCASFITDSHKQYHYMHNYE